MEMPACTGNSLEMDYSWDFKSTSGKAGRLDAPARRGVGKDEEDRHRRGQQRNDKRMTSPALLQPRH